MNRDFKKTIFLIDASSLLYRAYYGLHPLHTSKGVPIQAVYSFCRMIRLLMKRFSPAYMVAVWDSKGKTTRHEIYSEYKATRQAPPSDLYDQKQLIIEFADLIGLCQIAKQGIEADDLMYSIAQERKKEGDFICLVTLDKDMRQMLDEQTIIFDPMQEEFIDVAWFEEKKGFSIKKIPFYFALLGDTSDNIPGVPGVGAKSALELVTQFDSLADVYAHIDNVKSPRAKKALLENREKAFLSEQLFTLQYHPVGLEKTALVFDHTKWANALPLFQKLEFKSLISELEKEGHQQHVVDTMHKKIDVFAKYTFKTVVTEQELQELCTNLRAQQAFAIDTETNGLNPWVNDLVGISICYQEGLSYYVPCNHVMGQQLPCSTILAALKPIFEDNTIKKYLHHAKFDQLVLHNAGVEIHGVVFDTLIAARLVVEDWQRISLKYLSHFYFDEEMLSYEEIVKQGKYKDFSYVPLDLATKYSAADAHQTWKLKGLLEQMLHKQGLFDLFMTIEMPISQVLYAMEVEGITVDVGILKKLSERVSAELEIVQKQIVVLAGKEINLNSPKQVAALLYEDLNLAPGKKSAKGAYSTSQDVLEELALVHPVPNLILKYRELFKLKSTYIDALPTYISPRTNKIHTSFSQTIVATGRLASSEPNLQNIPTNSSGYGLEIRSAFIPPAGNLFLSADYSQIELRVLAHYSQDQNLIHAFLEKHDIHAETASRLFDVTLDQVTNEQRQIGKRINFSILYGLTPFGLSQDLNIPLKDAKLYIEKYFAQYPAVSIWMEGVVEEAKQHGYVTTWWQRRRYIPGIYEKNKSLYELAKRVAINTKGQGTAADVMKIGMINLSKAFQEQHLPAHIVLQIHDELLISVPEKHIQKTENLVKEVLEHVVDWVVPLEVTLRTGKNWKEVTK